VSTGSAWGTSLADPLTVGHGGTGRATGTTAYALIATGTTATGAQQSLAAGATTEILVGGGASALPVWTTATGTGAPARAGSPTFTGTVGCAAITPTGLVDISGASAGQIKFPASQNASADANTLDDYEEGTWTPSLNFDGGTTGITYSVQAGRYTKIGRGLLIEAELTLSSKGSSTGNSNISGLPFAVGLTNGINFAAGNNLNAVIVQIQSYVIATQTAFNPTYNASTGRITDTLVNNNTQFLINSIYSV
jgi:hypothetical protein